MPNCTRCGSNVPEGTASCPSCGQPVIAAPSPAYVAPPKQSALPILLVVLAIAVIAIVAIAGIGLFWLSTEQSGGGVGMTVNDFHFDDGENITARDWVVVNVTMSNDRLYDIPVSKVLFTLQSGGDNCHAILALEGYPIPRSLAPGESATFEMVFDVPAGTEPTRLVFNNVVAEVAVDL